MPLRSAHGVALPFPCRFSLSLSLSCVGACFTPPLPPALSPCARAGLCAHGSSPRDARDGDAVADRVTLGGAACAGWVPCVARGDAGRAGLSATGGCCAAPPWWLCVACGRAHVPVWWEEPASPLPADMLPSSSSSEPARLSRSE